MSGILSTNPDIGGFSYEYADGLYTALEGVEMDDDSRDPDR